jgi:hypothetical protein
MTLNIELDSMAKVSSRVDVNHVRLAAINDAVSLLPVFQSMRVDDILLRPEVTKDVPTHMCLRSLKPCAIEVKSKSVAIQ